VDAAVTEKPALLVIDMVKDNFDESRQLPITPLARRIIPPINAIGRAFREKGWPVVVPTDAFHPEDLIFTGRRKPHSLAGTPGAEIADELEVLSGDLRPPKPRFSAFFGTDLDRRLRAMGVTLCAVSGIATHFCVLASALDAVCHGFKVVVLEDCCAAASESTHEQALSLYRRNPLYPLFRIDSSRTLLEALSAGKGP